MRMQMMMKKIQTFRKPKENFGLYNPTKEKMDSIDEKCLEANCIAQVYGDSSFPCRKCSISNSFEKLTGIRLEKI
jgi:hypothetical protein